MKALVHYVAQILLFPVTWELFRHGDADITLPGPLEHHPTCDEQWTFNQRELDYVIKLSFVLI